MGLQNICVGIAITLLVFLFFTFLVVFAPKSQNFFKKANAGLDKLAADTDLICETFVNLGIELNEDGLFEEYKKYQRTTTELAWEPWPDIWSASGHVQYLPLYLFSEKNDKNIKMFEKLYNGICSTDTRAESIKSVFFLKLDSKSSLNKHKGWAEVVNDTLRFIYCFNSFCNNEEECGLWVNGEGKKLFKDNYYYYDASKEHSVYNNTFDSVIFLVVDFDRPEGVPKGCSDNFLKK